jgi:23S rRNA (guanosine2251-2'-O)-methyltransferase
MVLVTACSCCSNKRKAEEINLIIFGRKPVLEALKGGQSVQKLYIQSNTAGRIVEEILHAAQQKRVLIAEVSHEKITQISKSPQHQGIAALIAEEPVVDLTELIASTRGTQNPLFVVLDMIQDPHNLGAIIRTSEAVGAQGIILTKHNSAPLNETAVKASAGAAAHIPISVVHNLVQAIEELKHAGFWIVGSTLQNAADYRSVDYKRPLAVIIGNEEKGIRPLTAGHCDYLVRIPMRGKINSLNASVAAGILLFEIASLRERE